MLGACSEHAPSNLQEHTLRHGAGGQSIVEVKMRSAPMTIPPAAARLLVPPSCRPIEVRVTRNCASCSTRSIRRRSMSAISIPRPRSSSSSGAATCRGSASLALVVHLDRAAGPPEEAAALRDAIHEFFHQRAVCVAASAGRTVPPRPYQPGHRAGVPRRRDCGERRAGHVVRGSHVGGVLREGLLIVGWVAMWRPGEVFLYDWWPIRAEGGCTIG